MMTTSPSYQGTSGLRFYPFPIANAFALGWPLSLAIPNFFGNPTRMGFLGFCLLALVEALAAQLTVLFGRRSPVPTSYYLNLLAVIALVIVVAISVLRAPISVFEVSARNGLAAFIVLAATFLWSYLCVPRDREIVNRRLTRLCASIPIYLAIALALSVLFGDPVGARASRTYSETLAMAGIYTPRLSDLAGLIGSNTIGAVASMGVVISWAILLRVRGRPVKMMFWATMLVVASFVLIKSDGRALLASATAAMLASTLLGRRALKSVGLCLAIFLAASPWLIYSVFDTLNKSDAATSVLTRQTGNGAALGVGTGRQEIWQQAFILLNKGVAEHLFGHGSFGHYSAGISLASFDLIFEDTKTLETLHNTTLQAVFDIGYLGAILFFGVLISAVMVVTGRSMERVTRALTFGLLSLFMLIGLSEVIVGVYNLFPFFIFLAIIFHALASRKLHLTGQAL